MCNLIFFFFFFLTAVRPAISLNQYYQREKDKETSGKVRHSRHFVSFFLVVCMRKLQTFQFTKMKAMKTAYIKMSMSTINRLLNYY